MNKQVPLLTKDYFYRKASDCPIINACIMNHEHSGLSWEATLAQMVYYLSESNESLKQTSLELFKTTTMYLIKGE